MKEVADGGDGDDAIIELWSVTTALVVSADPEVFDEAGDKVAIELITEAADEVTDEAVVKQLVNIVS